MSEQNFCDGLLWCMAIFGGLILVYVIVAILTAIAEVLWERWVE